MGALALIGALVLFSAANEIKGNTLVMTVINNLSFM
jgi:hypothetical protein